MDSYNFERYLKILRIRAEEPDLNTLSSIIKAHLMRIPFENISKLYYLKKFNLKFIPSFNQFLAGVEKYNLGGTCYATNYYLHELLNFLGYSVHLCGADMKNPDVHVANVIKIGDKEFIVDVGYSAPFLETMPRDLDSDFRINAENNEYYILSPRDEKGQSKLSFFRNNEYRGNYTLKPEPRRISEFKQPIKNSFNSDATFMNSVLITKFGLHYFLKLHNLQFIEYNGNKIESFQISNKDELSKIIESKFHIPSIISNTALDNMSFTVNP